jgi:hypothetical protein
MTYEFPRNGLDGVDVFEAMFECSRKFIFNARQITTPLKR